MWRGASLAMDSTDDMSAKIIHSPTRHQPLVVSWKPVTRASNPSLRVGGFCHLNARRASQTVFMRDLTDTVRSTTAFDGCPTEVSRARWAAVQASIVVPWKHRQHSTEGNPSIRLLSEGSFRYATRLPMCVLERRAMSCGERDVLPSVMTRVCPCGGPVH